MVEKCREMQGIYLEIFTLIYSCRASVDLGFVSDREEGMQGLGDSGGNSDDFEPGNWTSYASLNAGNGAGNVGGGRGFFVDICGIFDTGDLRLKVFTFIYSC